MRKFRYSEIFSSIQGEGEYCGVPTAWYRDWGFNFNCSGFGQEKPEDPSTWKLDFEDLDVSKFTKMEDLPVFHRGCDSSYSWAKKFSHLSHQKTAKEICDEIQECLKSNLNPEGYFLHPISKQWTHMAFTGGEPLMSQTAIIAIMQEFMERDNCPKYVTVETNGTQELRAPFHHFIRDIYNHKCTDFYNVAQGNEWFWSVSPKLYVSGENWDDAINPHILAQYRTISNNGQLKYVVNGTLRSWDEVHNATDEFRKIGITWPVWIMPVGADIEMQEGHQAKISEDAIRQGYNVAARVHTWIWGNVVGK